MPRRKSSLADDLVLAPWWLSFGLGLAAFFVLAAVLPKPLQGLTTIVGFGLLALSVIAALRAWKTRRMLEQQTGIDSLRELPWKRFEDLLGEAYRRQGYSVEETLGGGADGGVDLVLRRGSEVTLVQCKRWSAKQTVKVPIVREMYGIMAERRAAAGKVVATTRFTSEAVAFASGKPIELVDAEALLELLRGVQTSGRLAARPAATTNEPTPTCPACGAEMKVRTAKRGANAGNRFFGCSRYPACKGTRDL